MLRCVVLALLCAVACAARPRFAAIDHNDHVEAVYNFVLHHDEVGLPPSETRKRGNHFQPYPNSISVGFEVFGKKFLFNNMQLMHDIVGENSTITYSHGDGDDEVKEVVPHTLQSYYQRDNKGNWITVTMYANNTVHGVLSQDGEVYQIDPLHTQQSLFHKETYSALEAHAPHSMMATNVALNNDGGTCGVIDENMHIHSHDHSVRKLLQLVEWNDCYTALPPPVKLSMGFIADYGFYRAYGSSRTDTQSAIYAIVAASNQIYNNQMQITLSVSDVIVKTGSSSDAWNMDPNGGANSCSSINAQLDALTAWRQARNADSAKFGLWHVMTNCWPPPGTVGLAYVGTLCGDYGTGVSTKSGSTWKTVAHEIGHNFDGSHSFEEGQGSTGGIMDYGDGLLNGVYQFNSKYRRTPICAHVQSVMSSKSTTDGNCFSRFIPECGNGIIEPGEECDDTSACCSNCQLTAGSQCSGSGNECCNACKIQPTTTKCMQDTGFCGNGGECTTSTLCDYYSNTAPFCKMEASNPCKIMCTYNGGCVSPDSFGNFPGDKFAPDGAVCSLNPPSVCVSGTCSATGATAPPVSSPTPKPPTTPPPTKQPTNPPVNNPTPRPTAQPVVTFTNAWTRGTWSTCAATGGSTLCSQTGKGTRTRTVRCVQSPGNTIVAENLCPAGTKPAETGVCSMSPCVTYEWRCGGDATCDDTSFGTCSTDCGGGVQVRAVDCYELGTSSKAAASDCTGTKPAETKACSTTDCNITWVYATWGDCNKLCGGGQRTRTATCIKVKDQANIPMADSACTNLEPLSETCNTQACNQTTWDFTMWGGCSAECGGGTQSRTVSCINSVTKLPIRETECVEAQKPNIMQACNNIPCGGYGWHVVNETAGVDASGWGQCTESCGIGQQSRKVLCENKGTNLYVEEIYCTKAKPELTRPCLVANCTDYQWEIGTWGTCSQSGCTDGDRTTGEQSRTVECVDFLDNHKVGDNANCAAKSTKPPRTQQCNFGACVSYKWFSSPYGPCLTTKGAADCQDQSTLKARDVYCIEERSGETVADSMCAGSKPIASMACKAAENTCDFQVGDWSDCSRVCGLGERIREVKCLKGNGTGCTTLTWPESTQACQMPDCGTFWSTTSWSACTLRCDGGTQTREVACYSRETNAEEDGSLGCLDERPATSQLCNIQECPKWEAGEWSDCDAPCSEGHQTRQIKCVGHTGLTLPNAECLQDIPAASRVCTNGPCPHWHRSPWEECDKQCGGGSQSRGLVCRYPHDASFLGEAVKPNLIDSICPKTQPTTSQACNVDPCSDFYWKITKGECSKSCGGGTRSLTAVCTNGVTGARADNAEKCIGDKPAATEPCNSLSCSAFGWKDFKFDQEKDWGECSKTCGGGIRKRDLRCVDNSNNNFEVQDDSVCEQVHKIPKSSFDPAGKLKPEEPCNTDANICGTKGKCDSANGVCQCDAGVGGEICEIPPTIQGVAVDSTSYSSGVPIGSQITITWRSTGPISRVNIVLDNLGWNVPEYIAVNVENSGQYLWTVGEHLEPGRNYRVMVWFSEDVHSESDLVHIGSVCSYKNCGLQGRCDAKTGECVCLNGWSGSTCRVSPCSALSCLASTSTCNDLAPECVCDKLGNQSFTGDRCQTPPGCSNMCGKGYPKAPVEFGGKCTECVCPNLFTGNNCETCGLKCGTGKPDAMCFACDCGTDSGFFGESCQCKYIIVNVNVGLSSDFLKDKPESHVSRLHASFATDVASAISIHVGRIIVQRVAAVGTGAIGIKFHLTETCQSTSLAVDGTTTEGVENPDTIAPDGGDNRTLAQLEKELLALFADGDSDLFRGVVTSSVNAGTAVVVNPHTAVPEPTGMGGGMIFLVILLVLGGIAGLGFGGYWLMQNKDDLPCADMFSGGGGGASSYTAHTSHMQQSQAPPVPVSMAPSINSAPPAPPAPPISNINALPAGWTEMVSENGDPYFYHAATDTSQWDRPQ